MRTDSTVRRSLPPALLLIPALLLVVFLLVIPLLNTVSTSFRVYSTQTGITNQLTLQNYRAVITGANLGVIFRTLELSAVASLICLLLGYPLAQRVVASTGRDRALIALIILSPLLVSVVIRTYGWIIILGPDGLLDSILVWFGVHDPPRFLYTSPAVVVGVTYIVLPYMVLTLASAINNIDSRLVLAARNLGSNRFVAFLRVSLPLSLPGILGGTLLTFAISCGTFVTPALLGGPNVEVLAQLVYDQDTVVFNWPLGSALGLTLLVVVGGTSLLYTGVMRLGRPRRIA